jgi:hypothetical protein
MGEKPCVVEDFIKNVRNRILSGRLCPWRGQRVLSGYKVDLKAEVPDKEYLLKNLQKILMVDVREPDFCRPKEG